MNSWIIVYTIGAAQGLILSAALWRKPVNTKSHKVLSVWLVLMAIDLIMKAIYLNDRETSLLPVYTLIQFFPFLYGSLFYLYARTLTLNVPLTMKDSIHFIGFAVMAGVNIHWILNPWDYQPVSFDIYEPSLYLYSVSYVIAGLLVINRYRLNLEQQQSNTEGIDLFWLGVMAYSQIVIWLVAITQWLFPHQYYNHWVIYIVISIWIILLGYLGLTQAPIKPLKEIPRGPDTEDQRFDEVEKKLQVLIEEKKIHLKPSLSIAQLAKSSGYPEYLISLLINRKYQCTFREYINQLRIKEAQILLSQDTSQTILDIAYACGFVSKSTFNTAFKRYTQLTPSAFRQEHQRDKSVGF